MKKPAKKSAKIKKYAVGGVVAPQAAARMPAQAMQRPAMPTQAAGRTMPTQAAGRAFKKGGTVKKKSMGRKGC